MFVIKWQCQAAVQKWWQQSESTGRTAKGYIRTEGLCAKGLESNKVWVAASDLLRVVSGCRCLASKVPLLQKLLLMFPRPEVKWLKTLLKSDAGLHRISQATHLHCSGQTWANSCRSFLGYDSMVLLAPGVFPTAHSYTVHFQVQAIRLL